MLQQLILFNTIYNSVFSYIVSISFIFEETNNTSSLETIVLRWMCSSTQTHYSDCKPTSLCSYT